MKVFKICRECVRIGRRAPCQPERKVDHISESAIIAQAGDVLRQRLAPLGEIDFLYLRQNKLAPCEALVVTSHSQEWRQDYHQRRRYLKDPVVLAARQRVSPFNWQDCSRPNAGLCEAGSQCQRVKGYTFAVHDPQQQMSLLSIIRRHDNLTFSQDVIPRLADLQMLLVALHEKTVILRDDVPALSAREQEVLLWSSRGKTYGEVAVILGIQLSTVKFHIANATRKLGVSNGKHAIRRALELNYLPSSLY
ncbi:hypothetical protein GN242_12305 [Erwinia sorbitola]|uniref:HTH luxR-type domain-containing protein n=1 Tax=Erwinia sorbitola TaxID=2681984 RepID=A0A6I6ESA7_9GAMM|nr:hypothetical protein GN242_12305 [Erwinia sorbitola]